MGSPRVPEGSPVPEGSLRGPHGFPWVPHGFLWFLWISISSYGVPWVPHGLLWIPMDSYGFPWVPKVLTKNQKIILFPQASRGDFEPDIRGEGMPARWWGVPRIKKNHFTYKMDPSRPYTNRIRTTYTRTLVYLMTLQIGCLWNFVIRKVWTEHYVEFHGPRSKVTAPKIMVG